MKTIILAAVATMSLGVGAAYAAGGLVGWEPQSYGTQATSNPNFATYICQAIEIG